MTKIMEYKIVRTSTRCELSDCVNASISNGWRPYGIPFYFNENFKYSDVWNQTMVRLSVKDEYEPIDEENTF